MKASHIKFDAPLSELDTENQTYGCRAGNPDICSNNSIPDVSAFSSNDFICGKSSRAWKKQYNKLMESK